MDIPSGRGGRGLPFPIIEASAAQRLLDRPARSPGRRKLDQEISSYLADIERSLLEASVKQSQLEEALETRIIIGQALGLLMAQESLSSDQAFQKFVRVSQSANIKLRDVACRYIETWQAKVKGRS